MLGRLGVAAVLVAAGLTFVVPGVAVAGGSSSCVVDPVTQQTVCTSTDPGSSGSTSGGSSSGGGCSTSAGQSIPCVVNGAYWFPSQDCYAMALPDGPGNPNPPSGSSYWVCVGTSGGLADAGGKPFVVPNSQAPVADPATLAQTAVGTLQLATAQVNTAPSPPHAEVVGVEVWLWVPQNQWQPLTKTVTAGATSVTATATPEKIIWNMGDGSQPTVCDNPGQAWVSTYTDSAQTDCGYTYQTLSSSQPGGVFPITATISYDVSWTCTGACTSAAGDLGLVAAPAGSGSIKTVQEQTVVIQP